MTDAFIICDARLVVLDADEAALRYFGQGPGKEAVIGKSLADLATDRERCDRYQDDRLAILISDVTAQKEAEAALRASEVKYRLAVESASDVIWISDIHLNTAYVSPSVERVLGFTVEERMEQDVTEQMTPESFFRVAAAVDEYMALEEDPGADPRRTLRIEAEYYRQDGSTVWMENQIGILRDAAGKATGFHGVARDITGQKKAMERLEALVGSEARYRSLFDQSVTGMAVLEEATGQVALANSAIAGMFGFRSPAEMGGVNALGYVLPEEREWVGQQMAQLVAHPEKRQTVTMKVKTQDGRDLTVTGSGASLDHEGRPAVLISVMDTTAASEAERRLQQSEEKYRDLFEHTLLGMEVIDAQTGRVVLANRSLARMFGCRSPEDIVGIDPMDYVMPEDREWVVRDMGQLLTDPSWDKVATIRFKAMDGRVRWASAMTTPFEYEGRPAMLVSMVDVTLAKESEIKLHEREEQYHLLVDNATEAIAVLQEGRIVYGNGRFMQASGYSLEEFLGAPSFLDFVHPDDRERMGGHYVRVVAGGEAPATYQFRFLTRAGDTGWAEANVTLVPWEGQPAALCLMNIITERKKAEEDLQRREEYFRALLETSSEGILVLHADGRVQYTSPGAVRLLDTETQRIGESVFGPIHQDDLPAAFEALKQCIAGSRPSVAELRARHRDGTWRLIEARLTNLLGDPAVGGILVNMRDVTERRKARRALEESEAKYRRVFEHTQVGMEIISGETGLVLMANEAAARMFGFASADECVGMDYREYVEAETREVAVGAMARALGDRVATAPGEVRVRTPDGRWIWVSGMVIATEYEGKPALLCTIVDVTGRRQAEETLRASEERNRVVVENTNEAIAVIQDGLIRFGNRRFAAVSGYAVEECLGRPFMEFVHPDDRQMMTEYATMRRSGGEAPTTYEFRFVNKAGDVGWAEANVSLIDWEGRSATLVSMNIITGRKKAEAEVRHSEERLSLALEAASAGMFDWNLITGEMHFSDRFYTMLGYDPGEFPATYQSYESLWHPDDKAELARLVQAYEENQTDHHEIEMRLRTKSGEWRWIRGHGRIVPVWGPDLRPARLVGAQFDITQRKEMEEQILRAHAELEARVEQRTSELKEANRLLIEEIRQRQQAQKKLQESESRYRELVENANSIILELDDRGRVTFFNRFAEEFYGFKEAEILGRHIVGTIAPPVDTAGKDMKAEIKSLVKHPEDHFVIENEGMRRNGERVWISWTNKGLHDEEGRLRNVLCIGMDRTEQRRVADMLAQQMKEKAAAEERQRLARDLHDAVTQTLFSASLIAEVLPRLWMKDRPEAERRLEELRRLTRGALAEMRMLLLELRPGALGEVGLVELLRQLVEATTAQTRLQLDLNFRGKCGVPRDVQVALYRVAQEALNNVVKHSGASEAQVRLSCRPGTADLSVSDNGSGFDPRAVSPKSLGLRIMRERTEAVGATLKIEGGAGGTKVRAAWSKGRRKVDS